MHNADAEARAHRLNAQLPDAAESVRPAISNTATPPRAIGRRALRPPSVPRTDAPGRFQKCTGKGVEARVMGPAGLVSRLMNLGVRSSWRSLLRRLRAQLGRAASGWRTDHPAADPGLWVPENPVILSDLDVRLLSPHAEGNSAGMVRQWEGGRDGW
jgi:hypothetical protein